jgi:hypothetical protein
MIFWDEGRVPESVFMVKIAASEPRRGLLEGCLELVNNFKKFKTIIAH